MVIHLKTIIGQRVKICSGVTLGRADIYHPAEGPPCEGIVVEDDVVLALGATVLCRQDVLRVGCGMVVGANAALLLYMGEGEAWAGVPAELVGQQVGVE